MYVCIVGGFKFTALKKVERIGTKGRGNVFASAKGKPTKVGSTGTVVRNSVMIISRITFRDCRVHIFPTTFLEIAVYFKTISALSTVLNL